MYLSGGECSPGFNEVRGVPSVQIAHRVLSSSLLMDIGNSPSFVLIQAWTGSVHILGLYLEHQLLGEASLHRAHLWLHPSSAVCLLGDCTVPSPLATPTQVLFLVFAKT